MNNTEWIKYGIQSIGQNVVVQMLKIDELKPFPNHPFRVVDDDDMDQLTASIAENGVMNPIIVRYDEDTDEYQIIAGHRRRHAARRVGLTEIPAIVKHMSEEEATIMMVDSNLQREKILPSEKAKAYKMRLDAMKRKAGRPGKNNSVPLAQNFEGKTSRELLGEQVGESQDQVRRYIRLTNLIPELLEMVDSNKIKLRTAVELSYLSEEAQRVLFDAIMQTGICPSLQSAGVLRERYGKKDSDSPTLEAIITILNDGRKDRKADTRLDAETRAQLESMSESAGVSMSAIVRDALAGNKIHFVGDEFKDELLQYKNDIARLNNRVAFLGGQIQTLASHSALPFNVESVIESAAKAIDEIRAELNDQRDMLIDTISRVDATLQKLNKGE